MNTTRSVKSPQNVTIAQNPDEGLSASINDRVKLVDYKGKKDGHRFINSDALSEFRPPHKSYEARLAKEYELMRTHPHNTMLLNRIGSIYLANGKLDKAQHTFQKVLHQDINNLEAIRKLATVYLAKGKPDKADDVFSLVIKDSESAQLLNEASIPKIILGKLDEATELLQRIPSSYRTYYEIVNNLGLIYLIQQNFIEAEKQFKKAAELNPRFAPALNNLGVIYQNTDKISAAERSYRSAIELDSNYADAYGNLFQLLVSQDKKEEAKEAIVSAQHLVKIQPELLFKYAWILMNLGKYEEAIKKYYELLDIMPNNGNTLNNIGFCHAELKQYDNALDLYEDATKNVKGHYLPHRNLMNLLTELGQTDRALHIAEQLIKIAPHDPIVQAALASAYITKDDWKNANKYLLPAYEKRPPVTYLYNLVGLYYADIEPDLKKGEEALMFPLRNDLPKKEEVYNNLAHLYLVNNKIDKAQSAIQFLNPDHPVVLATLGLYDLKRDEVKSAVAKYDKAVEITNDKFKPYVEQRKYFDLGQYYFDKNVQNNAKEYLTEAVASKGYKYIQDNALALLEALEDSDSQ